MGSMTFLEAYERTGRILNISVIPVGLKNVYPRSIVDSIALCLNTIV